MDPSGERSKSVADESPTGLTSDIPLSSPFQLRPVFTRDDVALYLGIKPSTVDEYARRGDLGSTKLGKHRRFTEDDVRTFVESGRQK